MTTAQILDLMARGNEARLAGRHDEAITHFRKILSLQPQHAEAMSLCGRSLSLTGKAGEALPLLERAVELDPRHIGFRINLANHLEKTGNFQAAIDVARVAVHQEPSLVQGWEFLGENYLRLGKVMDALFSFERAARTDPKEPRYSIKWAQAAIELNRFDEARAILNRISQSASHLPGLYQVYARLFNATYNWPAVIEAAKKWQALVPTEPESWLTMARAAHQAGLFIQAVGYSREALNLSKAPAVLAGHAQYCLDGQLFDEAGRTLDELEKTGTENAVTLSVRALHLTYTGQTERAREYCEKSLALEPSDVFTYKIMNLLDRSALTQKNLDALTTIIQDTKRNLLDRASAAFALAGGLQVRGKSEEAFQTFELANKFGEERGRTEGWIYKPEERKTEVDTIIKLYPRPTPPLGDRDRVTPVFIVGMPRSGSTLVESVIAAHPRVFGCGERLAMRNINMEALGSIKTQTLDALLSPKQVAQWKETYWQNLPQIGEADHITDKNPWNFDSVGLIRKLFPDAKIVHTRRNPVETGLSIFCNEFSKFSSFAHRLEDIGDYYGHYAKLIKHWETNFPDHFRTVQYEDFTANFESAGPALLNFCGLEWHPACAEYWKNPRPISTISAVQVRKPISAPNLRANEFETHLVPLVDALKKAHIDLKTGALKL